MPTSINAVGEESENLVWICDAGVQLYVARKFSWIGSYRRAVFTRINPGLALFFGVFIPELQHPIGTAFLYTSDYCIKRLPYGEGIEIKIKGLEDTEWTLDFAAPLNEEFTGRQVSGCMSLSIS